MKTGLARKDCPFRNTFTLIMAREGIKRPIVRKRGQILRRREKGLDATYPSH